MTRRKINGCKRSEKLLLGLFVLLAATILIGLSAPEGSLSLESISFGNGITGAAIGLQDPLVEETIVEEIVVPEEPLVEEPIVIGPELIPEVEDIPEQQSVQVHEDIGTQAACSSWPCNCGDTITASITIGGNLDCTDDGLVVAASNIVIDCAGYNLSGDGGSGDYGIDQTSAYNNVTIQNCNFYNFGRHIYVAGGSQAGVIENNIFVGSSNTYGIFLDDGDYWNVTNNNFSGTFATSAIRFDSNSPGNRFWRNIFNDDKGFSFQATSEDQQDFCVTGYGNFYNSSVQVTSLDEGVIPTDCGPTPNGSIYVNESLTSPIIDWGGNATYVSDMGTALRIANSTVYMLTNNTITGFYSSYGMYTTRSNVEIDCQGFTIMPTTPDTTTQRGLRVFDTGISIHDCVFDNFYYSIYAVTAGSQANIFNNSFTASSASHRAIYLDDGDYWNISHNNFSGSYTTDAIYFDGNCVGNNFWGNIFNDDKGFGFQAGSQSSQNFCVNGYGNFYNASVRVTSDDLGVLPTDCGPSTTIYVNESLTTPIIDWGGAATYVSDLGTALRSANTSVVMLTNNTLTSFYSSYGVHTTRSNVDINCQGFTIMPTSADITTQRGLYIYDTNINVHDCIFDNFYYGIETNFAGSQANIFNNSFTASSASHRAIYLNDGDYWNISHNNFSGSYANDAIYFDINAIGNRFWGNIFNDDKGFIGGATQNDQTFCVNGYGNYYASTVRVVSDGSGVPSTDCGPSTTIYVNESLTAPIIDWGGAATYVPDVGAAIRSANTSVVLLTNDTLTSFYSNYGMYTTHSNVDVDCQGFTIKPTLADNSGQRGLYVLDTGINVHDCTFDNFYYGIYTVTSGSQANIFNNSFTASSASHRAIYLDDGDYWNVSHNNFSGSYANDAIYFDNNCVGNNFWGNIFNDDKGFGFQAGSQSSQNFCVNGYGNFYNGSVTLVGVLPADCGPAPTGTIYVNDTATQEINWGVNATTTSIQSGIYNSNNTIEVSVGSGPYLEATESVRNFTILNCNGVTLQGSGADDGLYINGERNFVVNNCTFDNFNYGIKTQTATNNLIANCTFLNNDNAGIYLYYGSSYNIITSNNVSLNDDYGVWLDSSTGANQVLYNNITLNHIESNVDYGVHSDANAQNNLVYKNNFINNTLGSIQSYSESSTNDFNLSTLGNYWGDFDEVGEGCNPVGSVCDSPYNLTGSGSNKDYYPSTSLIVFGEETPIGVILTECGNLTTQGENYTLANNVNSTGTCFQIMNNSVTLDCAGYNINYSQAGIFGYGINITGHDNVTIENCLIYEGNTSTNYKSAIQLSNSNITTIFNNSIYTYGFGAIGVSLSQSNQNNISNNTIVLFQSLSYGLQLSSSSNNTIYGNQINTTWAHGIYGSSNNNFIENQINTQRQNNGFLISGTGGNLINNTITGEYAAGIYLSASQVTLQDNKINNTQYVGLEVSGSSLSSFNHTIGPDNLVEGLPIAYNFSLENQTVFENVDLTSTYGQVICAWCNNVTYNNITLRKDGLSLYQTYDSFVINSNITSDAGRGIYWYQGNGSIINNTITTYNQYGVGMKIYYAGPVNITNNAISTYNNSGVGVDLFSSTSSVVMGNNISTSCSDTTCYGIYSASDNLFVSGNVINTSGFGIFLSLQDNTIQNNVIYTTGSDADGIKVFDSDSHNISQNNITVMGHSSSGITLHSSLGNSLLDNVIQTFGNLYGYGVDFGSSYYATNNILSGGSITTNGSQSYGLYLYSGSNNSVSNVNISALNSDDLRFKDAVAIFSNSSFDKNNVSFESGATGNLTIRWYVDINVTNSTGALENANVSVYNVSDDLVNTSLTDATGFINTLTLTEFWQNASDKIYHTPHTINTSLATYTTNSTTINLTETNSTQVNVVLSLTPTDNSPNVTLVSPAASYINDTAATTEINFSCNATDDIQLQNISLYLTNSTNESFVLNQTTSITGTSNSSSWSLNLTTGNYTWNCLAYDNASQSDWDINRTILLNYTIVNSTTFTLNISENNTFQLTGRDAHTLTLNNVTSTAAEITFQSTPTNYTLAVGVPELVDEDDDNYYDHSINLDEVNEGSNATFTVISIFTAVPASETPVVGGSSGSGGGSSSGVVEEPEEVVEEIAEIEEIEETSEEVKEESITEEEKAVSKDDKLPLFGGAIALMPEFDVYLTYGGSFVLFILLILVVIKVISLINRKRKARESIITEEPIEEKVAKPSGGVIVIQKGKHKIVKIDKPSLKEEYDDVNKKLLELEEELKLPEVKKEVDKKLKVDRYGIKELVLQRGLRKVDARLHGYPTRKPIVIKASEENINLGKELDFVENELTQPGKRIPKNIKVITRIPDRKKPYENKFLERELNKVTSLLADSVKNPRLLLRNIFPKKKIKSVEKLLAEKKAQEEVIQISKKIEGKNPLPKNELQEVEEKLAKLRKQLEL